HTRWPRDWSSDVCSSDLTNSRHISQIRKFYREAHTITQQHGRIWYAEEHGYAVRLAKRADQPVRIICACLAVLSPRCQWPRVKRSEERRVGKEGSERMAM